MSNGYNDVRVKTKEDWLKVLESEEKNEKSIIIDIFKFVYNSYNHESNCGKIAEHSNKDKGGINLIIKSFGKRVINLLGIEEIIGDAGEYRYWNIPFETDEEKNGSIFIWKLRPLLVEALEEKYGLKFEPEIDEGVKFALSNCEKVLKLVSEHEEYKHLKKIVQREYNYLKSVKYTGNLYDRFLNFKEKGHKYSKDFEFLENYGLLSNEKMADYLFEHFSDELNHFWNIEDLEIGRAYTNREIENTFQCTYMGGMRRSLKTNSLVLVCRHDKPLYDDQWTDDNILYFTGMGKVGDQSLDSDQNKTLYESPTNGVKVYLFESFQENKYYYCGEVELCGDISYLQEYDEKGNYRRVIKFPVRRKDGLGATIVDKEDIEISEKNKEKEIKKYSKEELYEKVKTVKSNPSEREVRTVYRDRNQITATYTKKRANGVCDLCGKEAPFKDKNGNPYLESHHVITLADGGPDKIYNTVALCPNCHRQIHILKRKSDSKKLQKVILKYLLDEEDKKNIEYFNNLFNDK